MGLKNKNSGMKMNVVVIIGIVLIVCLALLSIFLFAQNSKIKHETLLFKTILYADSQVLEVSLTSQKGGSYYTEASFFYENQNYKNVESSCRLARGYYSESSQGYREIRSELESAEIEDPLINLYSDGLELLAEIELNMFEACEHFESASRYYEKYYNTKVSYDDPSYDMGTSEIEAMNEKIVLHDENVRKYNDILGDFRVELKERLE